MVPMPAHRNLRQRRALSRQAPEVFEKTLEHLYIRRETLENLIRSLESYRQTLEAETATEPRA